MDVYKRLVLDPRCLKPAYQVNDRNVYIDAINAITDAQNSPYITPSEYNILETIKLEIRRNRFMSRS